MDNGVVGVVIVVEVWVIISSIVEYLDGEIDVLLLADDRA